jgi:hypothetical protein
VSGWLFKMKSITMHGNINVKMTDQVSHSYKTIRGYSFVHFNHLINRKTKVTGPKSRGQCPNARMGSFTIWNLKNDEGCIDVELPDCCEHCNEHSASTNTT